MNVDVTLATRSKAARSVAQAALVQLIDGPDASVAVSFGPNGVTVGTSADCTLRLSDRRVSRHHVHITVAGDGFAVRDLASTNGTFIDGVKVERAVVPAGTVLLVGRTSLRLVPEEQAPIEAPGDVTSFGEMVGRAPSMRALFALLGRVAASSASVLVEGETGTGKELVARALHAHGPRAKEPFVVIDCGAISSGLVESELFGHVRGAFTGAHADRAGAFEHAHGGTLFLDELGELPLDMQPKLLRALESREIRKVGGSTTRAVDVRIVAGTHRDLAEMVDDGTFRADLYYRLAVVRVELPPLRERLEDLPLYVDKLLREAGASGFGPIRGDNLARLAAYDWPGNLRELRNVLQQALACAGRSPTFEALSLHLGRERTSRASRPSIAIDIDEPFAAGKDRVIGSYEADYLTALLAACDGNIAAVARRSGINRRHLYDLLKKHGLRA